MVGLSRGLRAAFVVCVVAVPLGAASSAQAGLLGSVAGSTSSTLNSLTSGTASNLVGGTLSATTQTINGVACPTTTTLTQTLSTTPGLGNGLGAIGAGVTTLTCASPLLSYQLVTRYKRADGSLLTRTTPAVLGVPALLNVDDDVLSDLNATISLTSLNTLGLKVNRELLKANANLPVSVEAVLTDTSKKLLGRQALAFGYDATDDQAPGGFTLDTPIDTITRPGGDFRVNLAQTARRNRIKLTAALYDGTPSARVNPTDVGIAYGASPDTASIVARVGDSTAVTLTTNRPGPTLISGRVADGDTVDRFDAQVNDLPSTLSLAADTRDGTAATYSAAARVASLDGTLQQSVAGRLTRKTRLTLTDVPTGLTASLKGDLVKVATTGGPIGLAKVASANGEPKALPDSEPAYVSTDDDGTVRSVAAKVPGLQAVDADLGAAPTVSARIAATPLLARIVEPGRRIDARVDRLPSRFTLGLDLAGGRFSYDGFGSGIAKITVDGLSTTPFFGRATKVKGTLEGIPAALTAQLGSTPGTTDITLSAPLAKVQLLASNGAEDLPAGAGQGAIYRDVPGGDYLVSARVLGLRRLALDTTGAQTLRAVTAGGPFSVQLRTGGLNLDGQVLDLPADTTLAFDQAAQRLSFTGRDAGGQPQGIARLALTASAPSGALVGRASRLQADVESIPADLTLSYAPDGDALNVTSSAPVGKIELAAADGPLDFTPGGDLPAGTGQGARFVDTAGSYRLGARLLGLRQIRATATGDTVALTAKTAGGPFRIDYVEDDLRATAQVLDLPRDLDATLDLPNGRLSIDGHGQSIDRLAFTAHATRPLFGRATDLDATLRDVPAQATLDLAQTGTGARLQASPDPIGRIEVVAADRPITDAAALLPEDDAQGAVFTDTPSTYLVAARVKELRKVTADLSGTLSLDLHTAGGPFVVRATTSDLTANVRLQDLPRDVTASFDAARGAFAFHGRNGEAPAGLDLVTLDVTGTGALFARATRVNARIEQLAPDVEVSVDPDGPTAHVQTSAPIGRLELLATDIPAGDPVPAIADGEQGVVLQDRTGQPFVLTARLLDLERLDLTLGGSRIGLQSTLRRTPFTATVRTDGLDLDTRIDQLPHETSLTLDPATGKVVFDGSEAVDRITATTNSTTPLFGRATHLSADLQDVPRHVELALDDDGGAARLDASDPIGKLELLVSQGSDDLPAPLDVQTAQGAVFRDRTGEPFVLAARVFALKALDVGLTDDLALKAQTAGGPFTVAVDTDGFGADAAILDLPPRADLAVDLADGSVRFTGRGADGTTPAGIHDLTIAGRLSQPILGGADRIRAHVVDLPGDVTLGFSQTDGGASLSADAPIALIELQGWDSSGPEPALPADQGVVLHSRPGQPFVLAARVRELSKLNADFGSDGPLVLQTKTAGGLFAADVQTEALQAQATIDTLPQELKLTLDLAGGKVTYAGSDGIGRIALQVHGDEPLFLGATDVEATLKDVPDAFGLDLPQSAGSRIALTADQPIGQIDVRAHSPNKDYPELAEGDAGAILDATGGELQLALRVFALRSLSVDLDPIALEADMAAGHRFVVDAKIDASTGGGTPIDVDAVIDQLPAHTALRLGDNVVGGEVHGSELSLQGSAPIDLVSLATKGIALLDGADSIKAELEQLPRSLTVTLPDTGELAHIRAQDGVGDVASIGQLRLAAATGDAELPADTYDAATGTATGNDLLRFRSKPGDVDVKARLTGLREVGLNLTPIKLDADFANAGRKLDLLASIANTDAAGAPTGTDTDVTALIDALPSHLSLGVGDAPETDGGGTQVVWTASQPINEISLEASGIELLEGAKSLSADIKGVPASFTMALPDTTLDPTAPLARLRVAGANLTGSGGPRIDELRLAAGSTPLPASSGNDRFAYSQATDALGIGIKLTNIKGLSVSLTPDVVLALDQEDTLNGGTKPIAIDASLPNGSGPPSAVTGTLNKPSFHTEVGVVLPSSAGGKTTLKLVNGTAALPRSMSSLALNATNLGSIPSASFSLANISRLLDVCLTTGTACERTDRLPGTLPDYVKSTTTSRTCLIGNSIGCTNFLQFPDTSAAGGAAGNNRPYPAQVSMDFDDHGTSGTSAAIAAMTTLGATINLGSGDPVQIQNLRFHRISLDLGTQPNGETFSTTTTLGNALPKLYLFIDSAALPFVMNKITYPPTIQQFSLGSDDRPATADRRIVWAPGKQQSGNAGVVTSSISARSGGSLNCNGTKVLQASGINILSVFGTGIALLPVCSSG